MRPTTRARWVLDTFSEQLRLQRGYRVGPTDLVLDVGSGQDPSPRANVLCDKFAGDATERHGQAIMADRPFLIADVEALPFADKTFDYVICSHVLEHVPDPVQATRELARVGRRGYIETPSASWEKVAGFPFHRWMVSKSGGRLVFRAKSGSVQDAELQSWFGYMLETLSLGERIWFARRRVGIYTTLHWEGDIPVDAVGESAPVEDFVSAQVGGEQQVVGESPNRSLGSRLIDAWGRRLRRRSQIAWPALRGLMRCPACHGRLDEKAPGGLDCRNCPRSYGYDSRGRPVLLAAP